MPARAHATRFALDACARPCFVLFSATLSLLRNDRRLELLHELLDDRSAHHTTVPSPPPERLCRILHLLHARVCVAACPTQASHPFISSTITNLCLNDCTIQDEVLNGKIEPATVLTAQLIFAMLAALLAAQLLTPLPPGDARSDHRPAHHPARRHNHRRTHRPAHCPALPPYPPPCRPPCLPPCPPPCTHRRDHRPSRSPFH